MKTRKNILTMVIAALSLLLAGALTAQERNTDNVVVILDGSGSMGGNMGDGQTKMRAAKVALRNALTTIDEETYFGLLAFSRNINGWAYDFQKLDRVKAWDAIKTVTEGGKTPLGKYLKMGADQLLTQRKELFNYGTYRLIVITDGEASDQDAMNRFAKELVNRGITLNVIGVGMEKQHSLKGLAHQYVDARDPEGLSAAVTSFLAEVPDSSATDAADEDNPYELIQAFPNAEAVVAVIDALSASGNHPLGTNP